MKAEKDKKTGKWLIQYRYTDWQGKRRKSTKRGFATKREAEEWLRNFLIKYQSDRLSLEIRRLWERLEHLETEDLYEVLADCRALMQQVIEITGDDCSVTWKASDFKTEILEDEKKSL